MWCSLCPPAQLWEGLSQHRQPEEEEEEEEGKQAATLGRQRDPCRLLQSNGNTTTPSCLPWGSLPPEAEQFYL